MGLVGCIVGESMQHSGCCQSCAHRTAQFLCHAPHDRAACSHTYQQITLASSKPRCGPWIKASCSRRLHACVYLPCGASPGARTSVNTHLYQRSLFIRDLQAHCSLRCLALHYANGPFFAWCHRTHGSCKLGSGAQPKHHRNAHSGLWWMQLGRGGLLHGDARGALLEVGGHTAHGGGGGW